MTYITAMITAFDSPFLSKHNTGLGNVLFQIASVYGISKKLNKSLSYVYLKSFCNKLKDLYNYDHGSTIYRNVPMNDNIIYTHAVQEHQINSINTHIYQTILDDNNTHNYIIRHYLECHLYFD